MYLLKRVRIHQRHNAKCYNKDSSLQGILAEFAGREMTSSFQNTMESEIHTLQGNTNYIKELERKIDSIEEKMRDQNKEIERIILKNREELAYRISEDLRLNNYRIAVIILLCGLIAIILLMRSRDFAHAHSEIN